MAKALTVKAIEAIKPEALRREIPDGGLPGLYLIVQPKRERDGKELPASISWAIRYRFDGKPKKHTIGPYPAFSLADARREASKQLRAISEGKDPAAEKAARKDRKVDLVSDAISVSVSGALRCVTTRFIAFVRVRMRSRVSFKFCSGIWLLASGFWALSSPL